MRYTKKNHPLRNWTPEGIINAHRLLWDDMARNNLRYKDTSTIWEELDIPKDYAYDFNHCFMCMITMPKGCFANYNCDPSLCPIHWSEKKQEFIHCEHGYYGRWVKGKPTSRWVKGKPTKRYAKLIRDMPIDREQVQNLLNDLWESLPDE